MDNGGHLLQKGGLQALPGDLGSSEREQKSRKTQKTHPILRWHAILAHHQPTRSKTGKARKGKPARGTQISLFKPYFSNLVDPYLLVRLEDLVALPLVILVGHGEFGRSEPSYLWVGRLRNTTTLQCVLQVSWWGLRCMKGTSRKVSLELQ